MDATLQQNGASVKRPLKTLDTVKGEDSARAIYVSAPSEKRRATDLLERFLERLMPDAPNERAFHEDIRTMRPAECRRELRQIRTALDFLGDTDDRRPWLVERARRLALWRRP